MERRLPLMLVRAIGFAAALALAGCSTTNWPGSASGPSAGLGTLSEVPVAEMETSSVAQLTAPADMWERIRSGFAMPDLNDPLVLQQQNWYQSHPQSLERMAERSRRYLFHIVEELELRDMPTELALLPFIESAFDPQALSRAKAAGLWQFIPSTGNAFDLRQNALRDDRRNVVASTRAALDYLQQLHDDFGDWQLALAAYNWGPGNVSNAIKRNQAAGLGTDFTALRMPAETRNYVPRLQALKNIVSNPGAYSLALPRIGNHPFFDTVAIERDIDVELAARLAGVSVSDFRALNPSQHKPVIFAAGTPQILLPWDNADRFKLQLRQAAPGSLASWTAWVAPKNISPAEVAQRFRMNEQELRSLNGIPNRMMIKKGSTVLVASNGQAPETASSQVINNAHIAYTPENVLRRTLVKAGKGDTIASIAARHDLPAETVARWNKMDSNARIAQGHRIVLYLPTGTVPSQTPAQSGKMRVTAQPTAATPPQRGQSTHASGKTQGKTATR